MQEYLKKKSKKIPLAFTRGTLVALVAERKGFEPPRRVFARLLDFESSAFNRTLPSLQVYKPDDYHTTKKICQCRRISLISAAKFFNKSLQSFCIIPPQHSVCQLIPG